MMRSRPSLILTLIGLLCSLPALAVSDEAAERRQLEQQRREIEARFKADSAECQTHFVVNSCIAALRTQRNAAIRPIEARERALDAAERKARAEAQAQRVADRQRDFAAEQARRRAEAQGKPAVTSAPPVLATTRKPPVALEVRQQQMQKQLEADKLAAEHQRQQLLERQQQLKQRQQDNADRLAARAANGRKPGAPLPTPSAADVASAASSAKR